MNLELNGESIRIKFKVMLRPKDDLPFVVDRSWSGKENAQNFLWLAMASNPRYISGTLLYVSMADETLLKSEEIEMKSDELNR